MRRLLLALGCALLFPALAAAQNDTTTTDEGPRVARHPFQITPTAGVLLQDTHSGFRRSSGTFGLDFLYELTPMFSVGLTGGVARPETDGTFFPLVAIPAGDTTLYYRVSQHVVEYTYGAHGVAQFPLGRLTPFASGSLGRYTFTLDPQAVGTTRRISGPMVSVGGGAQVRLGRRSGVTFELRDVILSSFDRNDFDATDPLLRDPTRFDPIPGGKPAPRSTVHSLRLTIGLSFIPESREGGR